MSDKSVNSVTTETPNSLVPIGSVIRVWRTYRNFSAAELADKAHISRGYVSKLENNRVKKPRYENLLNIATALDITVEDIYQMQLPEGQVFPDTVLPSVSNLVCEALQSDLEFIRNSATLNLEERSLAVEEIITYCRNVVDLILKHKASVNRR